MTRVFYLTPKGSWNLNNTTYSENEKNVVDYDWNIECNKDRIRIVIYEINNNLEMEVSSAMSNIEIIIINNNF